MVDPPNPAAVSSLVHRLSFELANVGLRDVELLNSLTDGRPNPRTMLAAFEERKEWQLKSSKVLTPMGDELRPTMTLITPDD